MGIETVRDFAFSPDGKLIAAVGFQYEPERNLVVHYLTFSDAATGRLVRRGEWDEQHDVWRIAYAPDGKTVATMSTDRTLRLWDVATAKLLREERLGGMAFLESIAFSPDAASHLLAIAAERSHPPLRRRNTSGTPGRSRSIEKHRPTSRRVLARWDDLGRGDGDGGAEIWLWRVERRQLAQAIHEPEGLPGLPPVVFARWKNPGRDGREGQLVLFDIATGNELGSVFRSLAWRTAHWRFHPMEKRSRPPETIRSCTSGTWRRARTDWRLPKPTQGGVTAFAFLDDGKTLVSGSEDRTVRIWDLPTGRSTKMLLAHGGWVRSLSVSADGSLLAAGSSYPEWGKVHVWNLKTGERLHPWPVEAAKPGLLLRGLTLSRGWLLRHRRIQRRLPPALGCLDRHGTPHRPAEAGEGTAPEYPQRSGQSRRRSGLLLARWPVGRLASARVAVQVVDLASGKLRFTEPASSHGGVSSRPTARAWRSSDKVARKEIKLADGRTRLDSSIRREHDRLARQPDGPRSPRDRDPRVPRGLPGVFSGRAGHRRRNLSFHAERGIIRIFRLRDKREIQTIETPCPWIAALSFTPDGKQIVAGLSDTSIVIWDVRGTGRHP